MVMQKFTVNSQSVPKTEWKQTDGDDCIISLTNAIGKKNMQQLMVYKKFLIKIIQPQYYTCSIIVWQNNCLYSTVTIASISSHHACLCAMIPALDTTTRVLEANAWHSPWMGGQCCYSLSGSTLLGWQEGRLVRENWCHSSPNVRFQKKRNQIKSNVDLYSALSKNL